MPTPSVNREVSPTLNCATDPQTTYTLSSRKAGTIPRVQPWTSRVSTTSNEEGSGPVQERRELVGVSGSGSNVASIRSGGRESGNGLGDIMLCGFRGGVGGKVGADNSLTGGDR